MIPLLLKELFRELPLKERAFARTKEISIGREPPAKPTGRMRFTRNKNDGYAVDRRAPDPVWGWIDTKTRGPEKAQPALF